MIAALPTAVQAPGQASLVRAKSRPRRRPHLPPRASGHTRARPRARSAGTAGRPDRTTLPAIRTHRRIRPTPIPQFNLPALSPLPALPKTASPPAAVIGVLGVPDVMRASTAAQLVQKVVGARRDKLAQDYQREQQVWRDTQQSLVRATRHPVRRNSCRPAPRHCRIALPRPRRQFRARNKIIQEAAQVSLQQVERVLVAVIRQVAESRGMNLVLHRQQVALNISDFDITDQVAAQLNSLLPSVTIPPDGEEPTVANTGGALASAPALAARAGGGSTQGQITPAMAGQEVGDPRFFSRSSPQTLSAIMAIASAELHVAADQTQRFSGVAPLQTATSREVSFLDNRRYADLLAETGAGIVILHPALASRLPPGCNGLLTREPYLAWARVCTLFYPRPAGRPGCHSTAAVDPSASIDPSVEIGPFAVVGAHTAIGAGSRIEAHAVIAPGVVIGMDCSIGAHVDTEPCNSWRSGGASSPGRVLVRRVLASRRTAPGVM